MAGRGVEWEDEAKDNGEEKDQESGGEEEKGEKVEGSREGKWESGAGRCAVTGRRVLGGTDGLRRVLV